MVGMKDAPRIWRGWTVQIDVQVTARKRFHYVVTDRGETYAVRRKWEDVITDLWDAGVTIFLVVGEKTRYLQTLRSGVDYRPAHIDAEEKCVEDLQERRDG